MAGQDCDQTFADQGNFLVLIAVVLWSLTGFIIKSVNASPVWINFIRSLTGGIFFLPFVFKERIEPIKTVYKTGFFMAMFLLALTLTTRLSSSAMAISMQYAAPMYVIGFGFYQNKKVETKKMIVLLLILSGVLLNMVDSLRFANKIAIFTGILTGLSFAFYSYNLQQVHSGSSLGIVSIINLTCAVFFLMMLPLDFKPVPTLPRDLGLLCFAGIVISGFSYSLYSSGLKHTAIETALIIGLIEPILNPVWVYLGTKEIPSPLTMAGVLLILLGAVCEVLFASDHPAVELQE